MAMRERDEVAKIVRDAGGQIVGRTRIQKVVYLLELTGQVNGFDFNFEYRHYGPYSEALSDAIHAADAFGLITEEERTAQWGGRYSIYKASEELERLIENDRVRFIKEAAAIDPVILEIAATAAYLYAVENFSDPWGETQRRKPEKATPERLDRAKKAYQKLLGLKTPQPLPAIA
ncbi:MAG TPA: hypothetical protein P5032_10430 [Candidatus Competibacter sp.]|nr:hypothetical protein [Candidatus Competibacter sp.]